MTFRPVGRHIASIFWVVGLTILYVPIITLIAYSFVGWDKPDGLTWAAYKGIWDDSSLLDALKSSLLIGASAATMSTLLGGFAALGLQHKSGKLTRLIDALTMIPIVLPEVVFGLGLLIWFVLLRISLGTISLVVAHVTFSVSYVFVTVRERVRLLDSSIDDAARDLGATSWQVFSKVQLPLMAPALVAGWMMAFTLSFDDFLISFFTGGPDTQTLPLALYAVIKFGVSPEVFAMASLVFGVSFVSSAIVAKMSS